MSTQGAASKRKHATSMIPQKLEIIWRLESGQSCSVITTIYVGLSTVNALKETGGPITILYRIK
jgi:hypothetical protein